MEESNWRILQNSYQSYLKSKSTLQATVEQAVIFAVH